MDEADIANYQLLHEQIYVPTFIAKIAEAGVDVSEADVANLVRIGSILREVDTNSTKSGAWSSNIRQGLENLIGVDSVERQVSERDLAHAVVTRNPAIKQAALGMLRAVAS